jgi:hypothetical protein
VDYGNLPEWIESSTGMVALGATLLSRHGDRAKDFGKSLEAQCEGMTGEEIVAALNQSDLLCELVEKGLAGATASAAEKKRRLLARVVASAITGDGLAAPDEYLIFMGTVTALDPPHIQLLVLLASPPSQVTQYQGTETEGALTLLDISWAWEDVVGTVEPLIAALDREGVIRNLAPARYDGHNLPAYTVTSYGRRLLQFLSRDELGSLHLREATLVARYEPEASKLSDSPHIVVKNLGPGDAKEIHVTSSPHGQAQGAVFLDEPEMVDLRPWDSYSIRCRPPALNTGPLYSLLLRWQDGRGTKEQRLTVVERAVRDR